ncbi:phosphoglycerate dehydrogenase [Feifania hominis]|uniref:D-3-phosphoglycerate dehydrogenase n=1 Tax=Feifania hominis TaxID=2763660 RepID=A0A926DF62_9FIRM|nr:phosphoglycerate dehydrogenase [Feifania hominis]MBC8536159.1 phosphoglycerate dehydrogenase [Feifania hominis]
MYQVKLINKIAPCGLDKLDRTKYVCAEEVEHPDALLVRSTSLHEIEFDSSLLAIARAGIGVNNIPLERCSEAGIAVFNTPGANANAVKELALCALFLASRKISDGIVWAKSLAGQAEVEKLVEKGKGQFVGPEIAGKKLGVIGLGAIGVMVCNTAHHLDMEVLGYDPYISVDSAWKLSRFVDKAADLNTIFTECDYISIHVPLTKETRGMLDREAFAKMKKNVRIINLARGELVNNADLAEALESGEVACYVTDFPSEEVLGMKNVVAIPHLGASTPESEDNCAVFAARELREYLENGNIVNSVNLPNLEVPRSAHTRICIINRNIPNMLQSITAAVAGVNLNIENLYNKSRGDYAYTIVEIDGPVADSVVKAIGDVDGVIRVRVL